MKRIVLLLMVACTLVLTGCKSDTALDTYSFGQKVIQMGQSEVIVDSPFDFGQVQKITTSDLGQPERMYAGLEKNYGIFVSATEGTKEAPLPALDAAAKASLDEFNKELNLVDIKWQTESVTVDGVPAIKATALLTGGQVQQSFSQYTFINKGVLWNIRYTYFPKVDISNEINDRVAGKIQITKKEG